MFSQLNLTEALYQKRFDRNGLTNDLASQFVCNNIFFHAVPLQYF
jgi:hypothetical protein